MTYHDYLRGLISYISGDTYIFHMQLQCLPKAQTITSGVPNDHTNTMVRSSPPPPLLLAVALLAAPSARALQVKPTPPPHPPKSLPATTTTAASTPAVWNRGDGGRGAPLRAYAAAEGHPRKPWLPLLKFPKSFAELFEVQGESTFRFPRAATSKKMAWLAGQRRSTANVNPQQSPSKTAL